MSGLTILPDLQQPAAALNTAITIAGLAPSIHNTQPWHWQTGTNSADLWAERRRQLTTSDPDARLLTISCGAALQHAQTALTAQGYGSTVLPFPDPSHPDHLARLNLTGPVPVTATGMRLYHAIGLRGTDRRPGRPEPVDDSALLSIILAVQAEGCFLHPLPPHQLPELANIVTQAQNTQTANPAWRTEITRWAGGTRPNGAGIPGASIPNHHPHTAVPQRDFGHPGTLPINDGNDDRAATYAILYGTADEPTDWLNSGRALSHAWLTATDTNLALMPLSAPIEVPTTRQALRHLLPRIGHPYLVLRLSETDEDWAPAPTPRLPTRHIMSLTK